MMTTYIYEPLNYGEAQIRTVHLHPAVDYSDPILISLQNVTIPRSCLCTPLESGPEANVPVPAESDVEKPVFIALSYVWGSPADPLEVFVESGPEGANTISITRNLDSALRHIRYKNRPLVIWIDAICIDQGNMEERSHQVAFMDSIYTVAKGTLVWLGPEENDSDHALAMLSYLGERVIHNSGGSIERHPDAPPREPDEPIWESLAEQNPYEEDDMRALISFFERPWFTRLWVRQEIALATHAQVVCGKARLDWIVFQNAASCFCRKPLAPSVPADLGNRFSSMKMAVTNICDINVGSYWYETLRNENQGVRFTDPRDAIYGVKSLMSISDEKLDVRPNYALETADVYMDVCVRIVECQGLTHFLDTCELSSISVPNLPSWVPDWSKPMTADRLLETPWSASGYISANATYLGDRVLRVSGTQIDKIESTRDLYNHDESEPVKNSTSFVDYIWDCYPGHSLIDSPYDEKESMKDAYCRTFAGDMLQEGQNPPDPRRPTFAQAKEALEKIWSLEEDWTGFEDLKRDPLVKRYLSACIYSIHGRCFFTTKDGYIGLAPLGTKAGDIISVILGCRFPVVLREEPAPGVNPDETRLKVVGVCYAHGLMSGEAIYGSLPSHYRAVKYPEAQDEELICGNTSAIWDSSMNDFKTDPKAVLEEFGIQPSAWTRKPHRLEVPDPVLRASGVGLRDFLLV